MQLISIMKLKSLIQNGPKLEIAEVEIEFIPGIPQIHFLGLPDRIIKESFYRIKSALKSAGYKFPLTNQMIVNIKPQHLRKSSRGVELAVALGLLLKTEQIERDSIKPDWIIYGELGLDGNVYEPSDLSKNSFDLIGADVLTGRREILTEDPFPYAYRLENLACMEIVTSHTPKTLKRPEIGLSRYFSEDEAEFLFLAAASGLHSLLAGDSGAGKSTLAHSLLSFLPEPASDEFVRIEKHWRPLIAPHQSISPAAFLGGGQNLFEGEIERAQGGVLLLDEMLEFDSEILESLRGPMTGEVLRLSRAASLREIASCFQVLATTNLCPCGKWTPVKKHISCRYSRLKCTRYLERFSGPLLDRFALLYFSKPVKERRVSGHEILARVEKFQAARAELGEAIYNLEIPPALFSYYSSQTSRRINYLQQICRILAVDAHSTNLNDLKIEIEHLNTAEKWVLAPFEQLEKGMS